MNVGPNPGEKALEEARDRVSSRSASLSYGGRCPLCHSMYTGVSLVFLYSDEKGWYCRCGGRLREEVMPATERRYRRYRLVVPEELRATRLELRHWLQKRTDDRVVVEVAGGGQDDMLTSLLVDG